MAEQEKLPSLETLLKDLEHPNPYINNQAGKDIARYWSKEAISGLFLRLDSLDIKTRRISVHALSYFGPRILPQIITKFLRTDSNLIKTSCIKILVKIASNNDIKDYPESITELVNIAIEDESPQINLGIISFLKLFKEEGLDRLIKLSRDSNVLRARAAVTAIGEIDSTSAHRCLMGIIDDDSIDSIVREGALDALQSKFNITRKI